MVETANKTVVDACDILSNSNSRGDVTFEITRKCGIIGTEKGGWTRELNVVVWNGGEPKFDVRSWNDDHTRMTRGITLSYEEALNLATALKAAI